MNQIKDAFEKAHQVKEIKESKESKESISSVIDTSEKKQREAVNLAKALVSKKRQEKIRKTSKKPKKRDNTISMPKGLNPAEMLQYAIDEGYMDSTDAQAYATLPLGTELPLISRLGNRTFDLYRIYPGMRAIVFEKTVGGKKVVKQVKFYRTMSKNTGNSGILNIFISAPFYMIHTLSLLRAKDVLRVNGEIRKKKLAGNRVFHNLDLRMIAEHEKTYGRIVVSPFPIKGKVSGLNNPREQGGSILLFDI
jgi:hypothetical protein